MTFTTLMMFQFFNVFNARSDEESAFAAFSEPLALGGHRLVAFSARDRFFALPAGSVLDHRAQHGSWLLCAAVATFCAVGSANSAQNESPRAMGGDRGGHRVARPGARGAAGTTRGTLDRR